MKIDPPKLTQDDLLQCTKILEAVVEDSLLLTQLSKEDRIRLLIAAGRVVHPDRDQVRRRIKAIRSFKRREKENKNREIRATTTMRTLRRDAVFIPPARDYEKEKTAPLKLLKKPRDCYICKKEYSEVHFFYDSMCLACATFNYEKRFQTASLKGRVALITGARLKIGYQAALMMLRAGANVVVTTRFPHDAALRFAREADFQEWKDRLQVHGLDLRHSPSVEIFTQFIEKELDRLDILINNAAQTVRRPPGFYSHLMEVETRPLRELPGPVQSILKNHEKCKQALTAQSSALQNQKSSDSAQWLSDWHGLSHSAALSQIPYRLEKSTNEDFPQGVYDADLQQLDKRSVNSWRLTLADVPTHEMLEVQLVNAVAPFILCSKLKPLMLRDPTGEKHIVNVSAMEGKFNRHTKTDKHPHTNMAKASLNMMTLTSARDYAKSGIFMNAVDTGWVTDEDPAAISSRKQDEHDFQPPLDIVDGAARICDPFFSGLNTGKHSWGNFLKDYFPTEW